MSAANPPSYSKVHYLLRPAKNIQRKMICEAVQRLERHYRVKDYRYVGFGSIYFGDFSLFHRTLEMTDMISIEGNRDDEDRVRFNIPYSCVDVKMGTSNERLPEIALAEKQWLLWLDYDFCIDATVLQDVRYAAANAVPGSVLLITLDVDFKGLNKLPPWAPEDHASEFEKRNPIQRLAYRIQRDVPPGTDVRGEAFAETCRRLLLSEISSGIAANYGYRHLPFRQILNLRYADGREMMTLGGVFLEDTSEISFASFGFSNLKFYSDSEKLYRITAPQLTPLEIRCLNQELPTSGTTTVPVSEEDLTNYREVYRYFPSFSEVEL